MSTSTQLTPIQAGAAIALGFGLNVSTVAAEFDPEVSSSVRLRTSLAILRQDWKLPPSTDFDTLSQDEDALRNETNHDARVAPGNENAHKVTFSEEMPPDPFDTFRHPDSNEINDVRNEMAPEPAAPGHNPLAAARSAATSPALAAPTSSTSVAAESEVRHFSTPRFQ